MAYLRLVRFFAVVLFLGCPIVNGAQDPSRISVPRSDTDPSMREQSKFSVRDDIEMVHFVDPSIFGPQEVRFSPGYQYFAVITERGLLEHNVVEDSLWVFRTGDIVSSLKSSGGTSNINRGPLVRMTAKHFPAIYDLEWLDEANVVFRAQTSDHKFQLVKVGAETGAVEPISGPDEDIGLFGQFDVRDGNAIYTTVSPSVNRAIIEEKKPRPAKVIANNLWNVLDLHAPDGSTLDPIAFDWRDLWAVIGGKRFRVDTSRFQDPLHINAGVLSRRIALSPDGRFAAIPLPVGSVPVRWSQYTINKGQSLFSQITAGSQNLNVNNTGLLAYQFFLIDLVKGTAKALVDAPIGSSGGYHRPRPVATWSSDGQKLALINTYLPVEDDSSPRVPCIAVLDVVTEKAVCVETLAADNKERRGERFTLLTDPHFAPNDARRLIFSYDNTTGDATSGTLTYQEAQDGTWSRINGAATQAPLKVMVQQSLNEPPKLVAVDKKTGASIVILDPNAKVREMNLGDASEYRWTDESGRDWAGGLVKPPNYVSDHRYPLVIQTHGFVKSEFVASGGLTTAFAARPLASTGIVVLQVNDQLCSLNYAGSPEESECAKRGYEAAVKKLVADGLVDPNKIGIVGFSQTGLYAMAMLTSTKVHIAAANISDATVGGYAEFLQMIDDPRGKDLSKNDVGRIGVAPFGEGLNKWFTDSPTFNMDKISTPVRFEAVSPISVFFMWEPYALLRYLGKPTEMIQIDYGTHPLSNPAERLASQDGNVDWFRFWLKGEEDSDPTKLEQYARWRELRKLQDQNERKTAHPEEKTN